jgi:hypothetical protein
MSTLFMQLNYDHNFSTFQCVNAFNLFVIHAQLLLPRAVEMHLRIEWNLLQVRQY